MNNIPDNIVMIIADSLRYDSVELANNPTPYLNKNSVKFTEARSAGCWTLPATASLFTGLYPHQHGATTQTRKIYNNVPTLAEKLKTIGYSTHQITANIATTDIFGLHRGFDEVIKIWTTVKPKFKKFQQALVLFGKPRLRKKLMSKDFLMDKMSEDLNAAKSWMQQMVDDSFNKARQIMARNLANHKRSFIFINLMETHFPYHISPVFKFSAPGFFDKFAEANNLFHMVNQTFLKTGKQHLSDKKLNRLKNRQITSWNLIAEKVDAFIKELHHQKNNFLCFGGDHGDAFGEQDWVYHFSNVTDAGNKVPLYILPPGHNSFKSIEKPVSTKNLFHTILKYCNVAANGPSLITEADYSEAIMQSYWYNNKNKTLAQFRNNQFCFLNGDERYRFSNGKWFQAPKMKNNQEEHFKLMIDSINPIKEFVHDAKRKKNLVQLFEDFNTFSKHLNT